MRLAWLALLAFLTAAPAQEVAPARAPFVPQAALDDFFVTHELNADTRDAARVVQICSDLHANIQDRFNEGGVEVLSPHYSALRDGTRPATPDSAAGPRGESKAFRVRHTD